jgi:mannose-6-phosphate isomerase-like protein (cupin superfamily)
LLLPLFVITKGEGQGRLGDKTIPLHEGMTVFVPAGMVHQFWTESDEGLELIIIMFGKGA